MENAEKIGNKGKAWLSGSAFLALLAAIGSGPCGRI